MMGPQEVSANPVPVIQDEMHAEIHDILGQLSGEIDPLDQELSDVIQQSQEHLLQRVRWTPTFGQKRDQNALYSNQYFHIFCCHFLFFENSFFTLLNRKFAILMQIPAAISASVYS